jgi:selenocysteine lyase/cysteine desulfurase
MIVSSQKSLFNIPPNVTFLNCANMSPLLNNAYQAGIDALLQRTTPWKIKTEDWFNPAEELRELFAQIIRTDKENIALIPSVSYGIAVAAKNISLKAHQKILVLDQQYPSNIYAWLELSKQSGAEIITVKRQMDQSWTDAIIQHIDANTGVVAIPNCHWTDGSLVDLEAVSDRVKKAGAKLVIDASQSLGAYPLDINKIKPDFLVTVGYKWLLGAYGLGYLYAGPEYCETGNPIEYSCLNKRGSEDFTRLADYRDEFRNGARRFDAGEFPAFINIPMAISALTQILAWGVENIQTTLSELTDAIESKAQLLGFETPERKDRAGHMIGVRLSDNQISQLGNKLSENQVYVSFRGSAMRVAPHLYNDLYDIDRLFDVLKGVVQRSAG